ncbi:hypothetical protein Taro_001703 [Colocasia esculenta]|uniref:Uncharacterized protein n=1 Tax=Colocasia esculenta TaxID=4460 RepID=A0A843TFB3_COLES|nr:hypothetical protein [Colocasia esculenta]
MEKPARSVTPVMCAAAVVFLGFLAFSCCVAAEFKKAKEKDMKLDGNLCSMPRTPAFGLGVTALVCLSIAQVAGTSAVALRMRSRGKKQSSSAAEGRPAVHRRQLRLCFTDQKSSKLCGVRCRVTFGLATVLLGAGSSMNKGQPYGQGWTDGKCYVVHGAVYLGSAALVAVTVALAAIMVVFASSAGAAGGARRRTGPDELHLPK